MASLFNLIGDPCKSMWNSPVELLLGFLSKINNSHLKILVPNLLNFFSNSVVFISFAMEEEDFQPPEICVVGMKPLGGWIFQKIMVSVFNFPLKVFG